MDNTKSLSHVRFRPRTSSRITEISQISRRTRSGAGTPTDFIREVDARFGGEKGADALEILGNYLAEEQKYLEEQMEIFNLYGMCLERDMIMAFQRERGRAVRPTIH